MPDPPDPVTLRCPDLEEAMDFFSARLGFRLDTIFPADEPRQAIMSGQGLSVRLVAADEPRRLAIDPDALEVTLQRGAEWTTGRAGMQYRDLLPSRCGTEAIGSHIRIPDGGPVGDYVHFHDVRLQVIYCHRGWVRVVYEDQGPPFILEPGDCVLQPPQIRHRVLESSGGLEVFEVTVPADHPTHVDHELELPTEDIRPDREYGGQRFVRHRASEAAWRTDRLSGFETRDLGIGDATAGLARVQVHRREGGRIESAWRPDSSLAIRIVLRGQATLIGGAQRHVLEEGAVARVPRGRHVELTDTSDDLEFLDVEIR